MASGDILECVQRQCGQEEVMIDDKCFDVFNESLCIGLGEAIYLSLMGDPSCQCKDGWGRNERKNKKDEIIWGRRKRVPELIKSGGRCYQEFTPGFCSGNQIVKYFDDNLFGCIINQCGNTSESIPH